MNAELNSDYREIADRLETIASKIRNGDKVISSTQSRFRVSNGEVEKYLLAIAKLGDCYVDIEFYTKEKIS